MTTPPNPITIDEIRTAALNTIRDGQGTVKTVSITDIYRRLRIKNTARNNNKTSRQISTTLRQMGLIPLAKTDEKRRRYLVPDTFPEK